MPDPNSSEFTLVIFVTSVTIRLSLCRYFAARKDYDVSNNNNDNGNDNTNTNTTNTRTNTPSCTPLPDEIPGRENRRASDPCRVQDPNFESLRRLQRFHSLNVMKPLPVPPNMRSLQNKASASSNNHNGNFHSSRSSIATDYSVPENGSEHGSPSYGFPGDLDADTALDERMLEDSEDMIIPDDMQRFLNERYHNTQSQPTSEDMQVGVGEGMCACVCVQEGGGVLLESGHAVS